MQLTTGTQRINAKILFVTMPADGHFNPLTGLAKHLQSLGCDVRWYTQDLYKEKLAKLQIQHYPCVHAPQLNQLNFEQFFTDRVKHKSQLAKFKFDLEHCFIRPVPAILKDIEDIHTTFHFDLVVADIMSFCIPLIKAQFNVPVIAAGIIPLMETSANLPPAGMGLVPADTVAGKIKHRVLHSITNALVFKKVNAIFREIIAGYGVEAPDGNIFDILYRSADVVLQSGTPGFEYNRSDMSANIQFTGPLLPYNSGAKAAWFDERLAVYNKIILVTQGTVEKDINKILIPTLEAFKNSDTLVIATTGGAHTAALKRMYACQNIIIEDFIPFADVMPFANAYVTNGGYGGTLLSVQHHLPLVVAGVHEGKNEICARVGFFKLGINLKTETPSPMQIKKAVEKVMNDTLYAQNVKRLANEFACYNANTIFEDTVKKLLQINKTSYRKTYQQQAATL
jgi:MGT family glycosyltransferase